MNQILQKYSQRIELSKQIKEVIIKEVNGKMEINNNVMVRYLDSKVRYIKHNGIVYSLNEEHMKYILKIKDINKSVLLEQIYRACELANRKVISEIKQNQRIVEYKKQFE